MPRYLHQLSAILFYVLAGSFFLCYLLWRNSIGGTFPLWWMETADIPLLICGMLYGGLSVYLSLGGEATRSRALIALIAVPLVLFFLIALILNFWTPQPFAS